MIWRWKKIREGERERKLGGKVEEHV